MANLLNIAALLNMAKYLYIQRAMSQKAGAKIKFGKHSRIKFGTLSDSASWLSSISQLTDSKSTHYYNATKTKPYNKKNKNTDSSDLKIITETMISITLTICISTSSRLHCLLLFHPLFIRAWIRISSVQARLLKCVSFNASFFTSFCNLHFHVWMCGYCMAVSGWQSMVFGLTQSVIFFAAAAIAKAHALASPLYIWE